MTASVAGLSAAGAFELQLLPFLTMAFAGMGLSSLHLGRKLRAWRAVLNFRRSWLSREIVFYSAFVGLAGLSLLFPTARWLTGAAMITGFAALVAIDRVYDLVLRHEPYRLHSDDSCSPPRW